ncbi:hypothetical protein [Pseudomonas sp. Gutcm_11s]|uniref:hypothetical protein n=1 Tax=Pseudomonas sp. Gutcm_11s TaxID=3026088 RepID=UPI002361708C|nr:hypothetical protein [Pseudomonas sp. Gutcm_11s]MDD0842108.1 hypothetical protein [Pseudomonas sp. Gutcm_11s]
MDKKPISQHFADLGAPLRNPRNSWGAVRHGAHEDQVILRVWEDRKQYIDGKWFRMVLGATSDSVGYMERMNHVSMLMARVPGYMVVCTAADVNARPRKIKDYSPLVLVPVGEVFPDDRGQVWAECLPAVPVSSLA